MMLDAQDFLPKSSALRGDSNGSRRKTDSLSELALLVDEGAYDAIEEFATIAARRAERTFNSAAVLFEARKQRFLEALEAHSSGVGRGDVLYVVQCLAAVEPVAPSRASFESLCRCLSLDTVTQHPSYRGWGVESGRRAAFLASRREVEKLMLLDATAASSAGREPPRSVSFSIVPGDDRDSHAVISSQLASIFDPAPHPPLSDPLTDGSALEQSRGSAAVPTRLDLIMDDLFKRSGGSRGQSTAPSRRGSITSHGQQQQRPTAESAILFTSTPSVPEILTAGPKQPGPVAGGPSALTSARSGIISPLRRRGQLRFAQESSVVLGDDSESFREALLHHDPGLPPPPLPPADAPRALDRHRHPTGKGQRPEVARCMLDASADNTLALAADAPSPPTPLSSYIASDSATVLRHLLPAAGILSRTTPVVLEDHGSASDAVEVTHARASPTILAEVHHQQWQQQQQQQYSRHGAGVAAAGSYMPLPPELANATATSVAAAAAAQPRSRNTDAPSAVSSSLPRYTGVIDLRAGLSNSDVNVPSVPPDNQLLLQQREHGIPRRGRRTSTQRVYEDGHEVAAALSFPPAMRDSDMYRRLSETPPRAKYPSAAGTSLPPSSTSAPVNVMYPSATAWTSTGFGADDGMASAPPARMQPGALPHVLWVTAGTGESTTTSTTASVGTTAAIATSVTGLDANDDAFPIARVRQAPTAAAALSFVSAAASTSTHASQRLDHGAPQPRNTGHVQLGAPRAAVSFPRAVAWEVVLEENNNDEGPTSRDSGGDIAAEQQQQNQSISTTASGPRLNTGLSLTSSSSQAASSKEGHGGSTAAVDHATAAGDVDVSKGADAEEVLGRSEGIAFTSSGSASNSSRKVRVWATVPVTSTGERSTDVVALSVNPLSPHHDATATGGARAVTERTADESLLGTSDAVGRGAAPIFHSRESDDDAFTRSVATATFSSTSPSAPAGASMLAAVAVSSAASISYEFRHLSESQTATEPLADEAAERQLQDQFDNGGASVVDSNDESAASSAAKFESYISEFLRVTALDIAAAAMKQSALLEHREHGMRARSVSSGEEEAAAVHGSAASDVALPVSSSTVGTEQWNSTVGTVQSSGVPTSAINTSNASSIVGRAADVFVAESSATSPISHTVSAIRSTTDTAAVDLPRASSNIRGGAGINVNSTTTGSNSSGNSSVDETDIPASFLISPLGLTGREGGDLSDVISLSDAVYGAYSAPAAAPAKGLSAEAIPALAAAVADRFDDSDNLHSSSNSSGSESAAAESPVTGSVFSDAAAAAALPAGVTASAPALVIASWSEVVFSNNDGAAERMNSSNLSVLMAASDDARDDVATAAVVNAAPPDDRAVGSETDNNNNSIGNNGSGTLARCANVHHSSSSSLDLASTSSGAVAVSSQSHSAPHSSANAFAPQSSATISTPQSPATARELAYNAQQQVVPRPPHTVAAVPASPQSAPSPPAAAASSTSFSPDSQHARAQAAATQQLLSLAAAVEAVVQRIAAPLVLRSASSSPPASELRPHPRSVSPTNVEHNAALSPLSPLLSFQSPAAASTPLLAAAQPRTHATTAAAASATAPADDVADSLLPATAARALPSSSTATPWSVHTTPPSNAAAIAPDSHSASRNSRSSLFVSGGTTAADVSVVDHSQQQPQQQQQIRRLSGATPALVRNLQDDGVAAISPRLSAAKQLSVAFSSPELSLPTFQPLTADSFASPPAVRDPSSSSKFVLNYTLSAQAASRTRVGGVDGASPQPLSPVEHATPPRSLSAAQVEVVHPISTAAPLTTQRTNDRGHAYTPPADDVFTVAAPPPAQPHGPHTHTHHQTPITLGGGSLATASPRTAGKYDDNTGRSQIDDLLNTGTLTHQRNAVFSTPSVPRLGAHDTSTSGGGHSGSGAGGLESLPHFVFSPVATFVDEQPIRCVAFDPSAGATASSIGSPLAFAIGTNSKALKVMMMLAPLQQQQQQSNGVGTSPAASSPYLSPARFTRPYGSTASPGLISTRSPSAASSAVLQSPSSAVYGRAGTASSSKSSSSDPLRVLHSWAGHHAGSVFAMDWTYAYAPTGTGSSTVSDIATTPGRWPAVYASPRGSGSNGSGSRTTQHQQYISDGDDDAAGDSFQNVSDDVALIATCSNDTTLRIARFRWAEAAATAGEDYDYVDADDDDSDNHGQPSFSQKLSTPRFSRRQRRRRNNYGSRRTAMIVGATSTILADCGTIRDVCWLSSSPTSGGYSSGGGVPLLACGGGGDYAVRVWSPLTPSTGASQHPIHTMSGHTAVVHSVRPWHGPGASPSGTSLVSASEDGTVRLWDTRQHRSALVMCLSDCERSSVLGTGMPISSVGAAGAVPLTSLSPIRDAASHAASVTSAPSAAESQGRMLAVGAMNGALGVVDILGMRVVASTVAVHGQCVRSLSTRGRLLLSASDDGTIAITALTFSRAAAAAVAWSNSGIASRGVDPAHPLPLLGRLRPALGRAVHRNKALCARWHPCGLPMVVSSSADRTAVVWSIGLEDEAHRAGSSGTRASLSGSVVGEGGDPSAFSGLLA